MLTSFSSISLLSFSLTLLSLGETAEAAALVPIGRHAPPYLASKLGAHKRAFTAWLKKSKTLTKDSEEEPYYGAEFGLLPPRSVASEEYYGAAYGLLPPRSEIPSEEHLSARGAPTDLPLGWGYQGCVQESNNVRLLGGFAFSSSQTTPNTCAAICGILKYEYSGVEFGRECYCANTLTGSGGNKKVESDCNMPCTGDATQTCGRDWRIQLSRYNKTLAALPSSTASASTSASSSIATGVNSTTTANSTASATATASLSNSTATMTGTMVNSTASRTASASASAKPTAAPVPEWLSLGCAVDDNTSNRVLKGKEYLWEYGNTIDNCIAKCEKDNYTFAGVEYGQECYCSNTLPSSTKFVADSECNMPCPGDNSENCGNGYRLDIYEFATAEDCDDTAPAVTSSSKLLPTGNMLVTGIPSSAVSNNVSVPTATQTVSASRMATSVRSSMAATSTVAGGPAATGLVQRVSTNIPQSSNSHDIFAHHMVGNTYPYKKADWAQDIALAKNAGVNGFALNLGSDWWQTARVADAYQAAAEAGDFTMFLSLDMTAMACGSTVDAATIVALVASFAQSSAQAKHNGKVLVSTFSGENCAFGRNSMADGWNTMFKQPLKLIGTEIFFVPSIFSDPSTFNSADFMDGELNWNSGWSMTDKPLDTSSDEQYMTALGSKEYMPAISPFFYTHFPPWGWNKNWIFRSDDFLYANRWEQVIAMRDRVKFTEILTWNDFGESSYIAPVHGALPEGSNKWVDGMKHDALLDVTRYYATAFKTGAYPEVTSDQIVWWARPHPKDATATNDPMSRPNNWNYTDDVLYALVFASADGIATLTSGSNSERYAVTKGLNKIKLPMSVGTVTAKLTRNGVDVISYDSTGEFTYTNSPTTYNFNYFVGSS